MPYWLIVHLPKKGAAYTNTANADLVKEWMAIVRSNPQRYTLLLDVPSMAYIFTSTDETLMYIHPDMRKEVT